jgi:hypothetical protein
MATVVSVMDRPSFEARADNIAIVDPWERTLTWVPRDLWCEGIGGGAPSDLTGSPGPVNRRGVPA